MASVLIDKLAKNKISTLQDQAMRIGTSSPSDYCQKVPEDRREAFGKLRQTIIDNLPAGYQECMSYGMIGYVVPKSIYAAGYHVDPNLPLPFMNLASQKNFIGFYHMGVYSDPKLLDWWQAGYAMACKYKLDMGKSCVRFKRMDDIPFKLVGQLVKKVSVQAWIKQYEAATVK
jgi:hypothetical protein